MNKFLWLNALALLVFLAEAPPKCRGDQLVGGQSEEQPANWGIRNMIDSLKPQISSQLSTLGPEGAYYRPTATLKPISYRTQVVNGINYFIKVRTRIGYEKLYYHVKVYESFDGRRTLTRIVGPMGKYTQLSYF